MVYKISSILIGLIIMSAIVSVFVLAMVNISNNTGVYFDNETIQKYNKAAELRSHANSIRANESDMGRSGSLIDILGDWFEQGYTTLRGTTDAYETVEEMSNDAAEDLHMGETGTILAAAIGSILIIIIIIGVIISTLTKREQ